MACKYCQNPLKMEYKVHQRESTVQKQREKCYVCSETNLHNAEEFKGVIFCFSCARRIFQSCVTVKRDKQQMNSRRNKSRSRSRRWRDANKTHDRSSMSNMNRVIELAQNISSDSDSYISDTAKKFNIRKPSITTQLAIQIRGEIPYECREAKSFKKQSTEMGVTTDITQELLNEINACFKTTLSNGTTRNSIVAPIPKNTSTKVLKRRRMRKIPLQINNKPICSDLRIAELGASTEIANMILRKKSEVAVIIKSDYKIKSTESKSESLINQDSDAEDVPAGLISACSSINNTGQTVKCLDRRIGSLMALPFKLFKKNILNRSSFVNLLMQFSHEDKTTKWNHIKQFFNDEITQHQVRGMRRLYSTVNRRKTAYKMGWLHLINNERKATFGCKHFKRSHSYRCMRAHTMKLAGPTNRQLACIRDKIKRYTIPKFVRDILEYVFLCAELKMSTMKRPVQQISKHSKYDLHTVYHANSRSKKDTNF